jgi:catechol 2,3-dioxygenase-like lactoylglutathione lyase family enzyme
MPSSTIGRGPGIGTGLRALVRSLLLGVSLAGPLAAQAPHPAIEPALMPAGAPRVAVAPAAPAAVHGVAAVGMTVSDLDRAVAFYTRVLAFETVGEQRVEEDAFGRLHGVDGARARVARLRLGDEDIELTEYLDATGRPVPAGSRSNDRWFQHIAIIVSDMERAYRHLEAHGVEPASISPQRLPDWNPTAGGIEAFYFKDSDGHTLEILRFPRGKGAAKWHRATERLFLGIDHTAIVVSDTERSLAFYRDLLGFRVVGESTNYGPEQERLNHVFGARLRITALRAGTGPAIELLEYLAPRDGRPYPADSRATDLWHWQTRLVTPDAEHAARQLHLRAVPFVSPGAVAFPARPLGFLKSLLVRDPDGHAMEIIQR